MTTPNRLLLLAAIFGCVASLTFGIFTYKQRQQYAAQLSAVEESLQAIPNFKYIGSFKSNTAEPAASLRKAQTLSQITQKETCQAVEDMQTKLNSAIAEKDRLASELDSNQKEAQAVKKELDQTKAHEQSVQNELKTLQAALEGQTPQQLLNKVRALEASVASIQKEAVELRSQLAATQQTSQSPKPNPNKPIGKVTAVNKPWGFIVVDLGKKDNLAEGAELNVNRGDMFIGKVRVVSVDAVTSTADIVPDRLKDDIQVGDQVF
ncbi:MAG: hypothetical protein V1746_04790 [bacterium]